jgi:hypothetical protein
MSSNGRPNPDITERLAHLRTDRRGIPVPYVNLWGEEDPARLRIAHDPHVGRPGVFLDDADQTVPDFTRQHMGRQRECMAAGLCQVCGRPVPWSRRFLVVAPMSTERIELGGRKDVPVVYEPWLDERCAQFATTRCPALIRRREDEDFHLVPATSRRQVVLVVSTGWLEGPLEAQSRRVKPAMWVKAALPGLLR